MGERAGGRAPKLETDRLVLRPWCEQDAASVYELARDPEVGPRAGWPPHESVAQSAQIIRDVLEGPESYAVCLQGNGGEEAALIGAIALKQGEACEHEHPLDELEVGYWVGRPYWERGYATEALEVLLDHAFDDLRAPAVWADHYVDNTGSRRVMEKCGFVYVRTEEVDVPLLGERRTIDIRRCANPRL